MPRNKGTSRKGKPRSADRAAGMGRALQKAQHKKFKPKSNGSSLGHGMAASGAGDIGTESHQPTDVTTESHQLTSVLETNDLTDFLARAALADREFECEKERFVVLDPNAREINDWEDNNDGDDGKNGNEDGAGFEFTELSIPKRPKWDTTTTPEQLDKNEKEAFLEWRRSIAQHEERVYSSASSSIAAAAASGRVASGTLTKITATPFEKNLEVWRQLWRVLERSDCVSMVVDGRNPLFYVSMDLKRHVEDDLGKCLVVVVNKCDYLTMEQRRRWSDHFTELGLEHVFFSAVREQEVLDEGDGVLPLVDGVVVPPPDGVDPKDGGADVEDGLEDDQSSLSNGIKPLLLDPNSIGIDSPLTRTQLLHILTQYTHLHQSTTTTTTTTPQQPPKHIEIGMVGFPNVGKSSVLNVLVGSSRRNHSSHRVGVAPQPGKTRHFQTLLVPDRPDVTLCDCPGLVFPSFVSGNADLIVSGVFPLSRVRDFREAVELVVRRIPRVVLEAFYGIELTSGSRLDARIDEQRKHRLPPPTVDELLDTYCIARSLLTASSGVPDHHRASRVVLSDYVTGKLLFCHAPPPPSLSAAAAAALSGNGGDNDGEWEASFRRETISTALARATKLREKLAVVSPVSLSGGSGGTNRDEGSASLPVSAPSDRVPNLDDEFDGEDMLDFIEGANNTTNDQGQRNPGGNRGKKHKTIQKWGKKGRKNRNKDPYGCHTEPDEELLRSTGGAGAGICVNAGKYGSKGYTRPDYAGAKAAVAYGKMKGTVR